MNFFTVDLKQNSSILFQALMPSNSSLSRVAYSPGEFAALFGKSQTWGYRQIYAQKVKAITEHGRILVPAKEVERILGAATEYTGAKRPRISKPSRATVEERNRAWREFVAGRRGSETEARPKAANANGLRGEVLQRLTRGKKKPLRGPRKTFR